jgi:hypothetical protein
MKLTTEELNALLIMVSNAPISGKDAKFVAALMDKLQIMLEDTGKPKESTP